MKNFSKIKIFALALIFFTGFISCSNDDDDVNVPPVTETNTIADFVASNDNYSSLAAALERANLASTLDGSANYTVFAPDNDAFAAFLADNGFSSLDEVPEDLLTRVLMNHVQEGQITSGDLATGYISSMASADASDENLSMYINTSNGVRINGVAGVETADIMVDNGVIHAVDAVIGLPDIVTFALADPNFESLVAALTREESFAFVETLMMTDDPAPFTVFAPTNDAFADLLDDLEANSLDDIPTDVLESVLSYHVIAGANVRSSDLVDDMQVGTLAEQDFTINLGDAATITDANGRVSTIVAVDVQANNGVIHALDTVLLPTM